LLGNGCEIFCAVRSFEIFSYEKCEAGGLGRIEVGSSEKEKCPPLEPDIKKAKYNWNYQVKEDGMGGVCSTNV
jgi:hypothetical protein